jgi:hypothetical protein
MSNIDRLPSPSATLSNDDPVPSTRPEHTNDQGPIVSATPTPFDAAPTNNPQYKSESSSKSGSPTPASASSAPDTKATGTANTTSSTDALAPRVAAQARQASSLYEQSPSYGKQGDDYVRQMVVAHAAELGLSPDDAQHLDLHRVYWTEFEPRFLPSNGPVGYPPRPNPDAGKFVRATPLSLVPLTNLVDTWQHDERIHITTSNHPDQTAGSVRDLIDPSKFADLFKDKNSASGGFKASYTREVQTYFDAHRDALRHYQQDKALLALDAQQADGRAPSMQASDYALLKQLLQGQPDPALKGQYHIQPLQIGGYVSPSALVVTDERANGATYLYLPGEPQPYLRFANVDAARRYIENRTDGPAAAHDFAITYFSSNDALGGWNAIQPGVEGYLNNIGDLRRRGGDLGKFDDKVIGFDHDATDDPFGKQVDTAREKALDQADFDITSEQDKTDKRHYDEAGKYAYLPFSEVVQLYYAKTGEQKREALKRLAVDALNTVVMAGAGKAFAPLARNVVQMLGKEKPKLPGALSHDDAALPSAGKGDVTTTGGTAPGPTAVKPEPVLMQDDQLPPAANVSEKDLQPQGDTNAIAFDDKGNRYWNYRDKHYLLREDAQLSRAGHPVYRLVDPANPYAYPTHTNVLVPDGNGGLVPRKAGLAGGSDSYEDLERWLDDYIQDDAGEDHNFMEESDFDRYLREEQEYEQTLASQTPASGPGTSTSTSTSSAGTSASTAGTSASSRGTPAPKIDISGEPFSSTFARGVRKGFAKGRVALDEVAALPQVNTTPIAATGQRQFYIGKTPVSGKRFTYNRVSETGPSEAPYDIVKKALEDSGYEVTPRKATKALGHKTEYLRATKAGQSFDVFPRNGVFQPSRNIIFSTVPPNLSQGPDPFPRLVATYCPDAQGNSGYIYFGNF